MRIPLYQAFIRPESVAQYPILLIVGAGPVTHVGTYLTTHLAKSQERKVTSTTLAELVDIVKTGNQQVSMFSQPSFYRCVELTLPLTKQQQGMLDEITKHLIESSAIRAIIPVVGTKQLPAIPSIIVPTTLGKSEAMQMVESVVQGDAQQRVSYLISHAFAVAQTLSSEAIFSLIMYGQMLGSRIVPEFLQQRLSGLDASQSSLFDLSTAFFARDRVKFMNLYAKLEDQYPVQFWISWWSDQLFRAHGVIVAKKRKDQAALSGISAKLPFSFIERDYRLHDENKIVQFLHQLYEIDAGIKSGTSESSLAYWYLQWFGK